MKTVCVLFGGVSSEHEVSLRSAASVLENIDRTLYGVVMLGITRDGRWLHYGGPEDLIIDGRWERSAHCTPAVFSPDRTRRGLLVYGGDGVRLEPVDVVLPVLHGKNGEDGTVQGMLDLAGIPYAGSGVLGSALCMDKAVAHVLLEAAGIPKTKLVALRRADTAGFDALEQRLRAELGYPMFVKPANAGSSVGVSKAADAAGLRAAFDAAFAHDRKIVVEQAVQGHEIECSVMGNDEPFASEVLGEIRPAVDFYDYDAKYITDTTELVIPAPLPDDVVRRVRDTAVRAYTALECAGFARVDFFVKEDGAVILNEINTIPGFTSISMFPKLLEAGGMPYSRVITRLIEFALEK